MSLFSLGLKTRIHGGFATLVLLVLVLASFVCWDLSTISTNVESMAAISAKAKRSLEISDRMQIIRRASLSLMLDGDEGAMSEATAAESSSVELLNVASASALSEQ